MKIACDLDGCLADLHSTVLDLINYRNKTKYTVDQIDGWSWFQKNGLWQDFQDTLDLIDASYLDRAIRPVSPFACPTIKWVQKRGHLLEILTSNEERRRPKISAWLFGHGIDAPVRCLGRVSAAEKLRLGHTYFIDDSPEIVQAIASEPGKHLLLVDRPWNRQCHLSDNITRVVDWYDMKRHLEELGL